MSLTSARIKEIRSLREKKFRDSLGLFVVEGEKMVNEALSSGFDVLEVIRRDDVGSETMSRISVFDSPSPSLAVVRQRHSLIPANPGGLALALDSVRDPGNMGTIIRMADWFGVKTIYASEDCVELYNPKVVAATMGSIFRVNVVYAPLDTVLAAYSGRVYGTFLGGENIYTADLPQDALIVMGNEAHGISAAVAGNVDHRITIPSFNEDGPESLNVAIATAISLSEWRRR